MNHRQVLRTRLLSALGLGVFGVAAPLGCNGELERRDLLPSCDHASVECWAPGTTHFNTGNLPPEQAPPLPEPVFDEHGCQVRSQVSEGCCNGARTGPELIDGECCYGFCVAACCGRPLRVDGDLRLCDVVARGDWRAELGAIEEGALSPGARAVLAREWLEDARQEHASVASFARFLLDLLAFGAPLDLVRDATRAAADEGNHAAICFDVASRYAGSSFGPGALAMAGVRPSATLAEAAASAAREGCVAETLAAFVAGERARRATVPALRSVLAGISEDETRHAELGFRFVRWAIETGGEAVRLAVSRALSGVGSARVEAAESRARPELVEHGWLAPRERQELEATALREIVEPCVRALLAGVAVKRSEQRSLASV